MTAYDPSLHTGKKGFFGWFRPGAAGTGRPERASGAANHLRVIAPGSRADVIANIAEFLAKYDLDICGCTLGVAHDYVSGADPLLMRLIHEREVIGQAITVDWLKKLRGQHKEDAEANEVHRAFEKLEVQLVEFGVTAAAARQATHEYGTSLEGHAEQLSAAQDLNASVSGLLGVVRGMIDRTSEMEKDMSRSQEQSEALRRNLEAAVRAAEEDYLTGLPNRRAFEKTFENEYRDARHARDALVIGVCDIDHFKRINDTFGHDTGDRVLKVGCAQPFGDLERTLLHRPPWGRGIRGPVPRAVDGPGAANARRRAGRTRRTAAGQPCNPDRDRQCDLLGRACGGFFLFRPQSSHEGRRQCFISGERTGQEPNRGCVSY